MLVVNYFNYQNNPLRNDNKEYNLDNLHALQDVLTSLQPYSDNVKSFAFINMPYLVQLPSLAAFPYMQNLRVVCCDNFACFPDDFAANQYLTELTVNYSELAECPDFSCFRHLKRLNLSNNIRLTKLPALPMLIYSVTASKCSLTDISSVSICNVLELLDVGNNQLTRMPSICSTYIKRVDIQSNPLSPRHAFPVWFGLYSDRFTGSARFAELILIMTDTPILSFIQKLRGQRLFANDDKHNTNDASLSFFAQLAHNFINNRLFFYSVPVVCMFMEKWNQMIALLDNIRWTFYLVKCRRRLRHWLFTRVLLPLMEKKYRPEKLQEYVDTHPDIHDTDMIASIVW